jgi:hypothetical protein
MPCYTRISHHPKQFIFKARNNIEVAAGVCLQASSDTRQAIAVACFWHTLTSPTRHRHQLARKDIVVPCTARATGSWQHARRFDRRNGCTDRTVRNRIGTAPCPGCRPCGCTLKMYAVQITQRACIMVPFSLLLRAIRPLPIGARAEGPASSQRGSLARSDSHVYAFHLLWTPKHASRHQTISRSPTCSAIERAATAPTAGTLLLVHITHVLNALKYCKHSLQVQSCAPFRCPSTKGCAVPIGRG